MRIWKGRLTALEEYADVATKCVTNCEKNRDRYLVILSRNDEALNSQRTSEELHHYYEIVWDEEQTHKFKNISPHLQRIKAFKTSGSAVASGTLPVPDALLILWG